MTERNQGIRKLPEGIGIVKVSNIHCKKWIMILTKLILPQLLDSTHNSLPSCLNQ